MRPARRGERTPHSQARIRQQQRRRAWRGGRWRRRQRDAPADPAGPQPADTAAEERGGAGHRRPQ
eukprot:scaffold65594_cov42-Prasinocladus_malaysianus.AAC.1